MRTAKNNKSVLEQLDLCGSVEMISFDVFDTLLTRRIGHPSSVFLFLGRSLVEKGLFSGTPEQFERARLLAAHRARRHVRPPADVSLAAIYDELVHGWPGLASHSERMQELELEMEQRSICPVRGAADWVAKARQRCQCVAFISDMYLPQSFVRDLLLKYELASPEDPVYVSSACGHKKSHNGSLLIHALRDQGLSAERSVHIGDDPGSDVRAARLVGMRSIHSQTAALNRYEQALDAGKWESLGLTCAMAGASRVTRLTWAGRKPDAFVRVLAGVAAPLLTGFVLWLFQRASESGVKTLYFLAREGEVLFQVAQVMNERLGLGLSLRILYVSRRAINLGLLVEPSRDDLEMALTHTSILSLRGILEQIGLTPEQIRNDLDAIGLPENYWELTLNEAQRTSLIAALISGSARDALICSARENRQLMDDYLAGEGVYQAQQVGLVDTTGTGSQLRTLSRLRVGQGCGEPIGYLVVRDWNNHLPNKDFPSIHAYVTDLFNGRGYGRIPGLIQMLEIFALTDYGTVLKYKRTPDHGVQPVLEKVRHNRVVSCTQDSLREVLRTFAFELELESGFLKAGADARSGILAAFQLFWEHPVSDEATYWGSFEFELGSGSEHNYSELAPGLRVRDLFGLANTVPSAYAWHKWGAASKFRSPHYVQLLIRAYQIGRRLKIRLVS